MQAHHFLLALLFAANPRPAHLQIRVNLCFLFNTCKNDRQDNGRSDEGDSGYAAPPARIVDDTWIEPEGDSKGFLFHFAHAGNGIDWSDADRYCADLGGFLAEPRSRTEHAFLAAQARNHPNINWWIGLRGSEDCSCKPPVDLRSPSQSFRADIDYGRIRDRESTRVDRVRTVCPNGFTKLCKGNTWRWIDSGEYLSDGEGFNKWNQRTREPNSDRENCVVMWAKANYKWADWTCQTSNDRNVLTSIDGNARFRPLCQKDSLDDDLYDDYDDGDYDSGGEGDGDTEKVCSEAGVKHKGQTEVDRIMGAYSHKECRRQCALNTRCDSWFWKGHKKNRACILSAGGIVRTKPAPTGAFSGVLKSDGRCRRETDLSTGYITPTANPEYCVQYGVGYEGGARLRFEDDIADAEECKTLCVDTDGCAFWSFASSSRGVCQLMAGNDFAMSKKSGHTSGSVLGDCGASGVKLDEMAKCNCVENPSDAFVNGGGTPINPISTRVSPVIGPRFGARIRTKRQTLTIDVRCSEGRVRECSRGQEDLAAPNNVNEEEQEVCAEYNVSYDGGAPETVSGVFDAEVCRAKCIQDGRCEFWTWGEDRKCGLIRSGSYTPAVNIGSVSGSLAGRCASLALSQLTRCECVGFGDDYDEYDLTGLIDIRSNVESDKSRCAGANEGLRCFASDASPALPVLRGRIGGSFTRSGSQEESSDAVVFDDSRVIFGQSG